MMILNISMRHSISYNFDMVKGTVFKATGSFYKVRDENGEFHQCRLRGNLRLGENNFTNPVAVGDVVTLVPDKSGISLIQAVEARRNYMVRKSVKLSSQAQIIASNIDLAILIVTLVRPKTYTAFLDRFLVTAGAYHIPPALVFNKTDLLSKREMEELSGLMKLYESLGYPCFAISALNDPSFPELLEIMKGKTTLISGYSGSGKSTLLNRIDPKLSLVTGEVSESFESGRHTTTYAEMHIINGLGMVIDTPGIKGLGLIDIPKTELFHYFPEMLAFVNKCRFNNCSHISEPGCAVLGACASARISASRYESYVDMFNGDGEKYR